MKITTNGVACDIIDGMELTTEERKQFDYLDWSAIEEGTESASFFRYRGELYDLGEFTIGAPAGWDGVRPDSFFSALVVRIVDDGERVVVGLALS